MEHYILEKLMIVAKNFYSSNLENGNLKILKCLQVLDFTDLFFSASSLENTCHKDKIKEISNLIRIPGLMKNSKKTQNRMSVWYI